MTAITTEDTVRCSTWAREQQLDPIGSAGSYAGFALIETPLPWPRDSGLIDEVASIAPMLEGRRLRVQLLVPPAADGRRRLVLYGDETAPNDAWFSAFRRRETTIDDDLRSAVQSLLDRGDDGADGGSDADREVLICTHGSRDICCGSLGTRLWQQVAPRLSAQRIPLARTSHTGGHRFAPTFIVLPEATAWAFADEELVDKVLNRSVPFTEVAARYRGCSGLGGPHVQAVEREVLSSVGWDLLDRRRRGHPTGETARDGSVEIRFEVENADRSVERWEAVVRPGRTLPVPDCMKPLSEAKKSETEWLVQELRAL